MEIRDGELALRDPRDSDEQPLREIMREPEVARWWPDPIRAREQGLTVEVDGAIVGWLEHHEEAYEWYPSVAFDLFLTSSLHGGGYGRRALSLAIEQFAAKGHHRFTVDPNAENERAIRCYEAVGFRRVGIMRAYERNRDGGWNDALLMELIRLPA